MAVNTEVNTADLTVPNNNAILTKGEQEILGWNKKVNNFYHLKNKSYHYYNLICYRVDQYTL